MTDNKQQKLTPTQEKAAQMLADGCKIRAITKALNVNRGTVWNWSRQALFIAETNRIRNEYRDSCRSIMLGLLDEAGETLRRCLNSEADSVALKAALAVIGAGIGLPTAEFCLVKIEEDINLELNQLSFFLPGHSTSSQKIEFIFGRVKSNFTITVIGKLSISPTARTYCPELSSLKTLM